ncbi:MAG: hypothetical protein AB7I08_12365 [Thermoleophilia bacterium]
MSPLGGTLLIVGAGLEFFGIVALGWPDFIPWRDGLSAWATRTWGWIRLRVLRRKGRSYSVTLGSAAESSHALRFTAIKGPPKGQSLAETVGWLVNRDREAQQKEQDLEHLIQDLDKAVDQRMDSSRDEMRGEYEAKLSEALEQYRSLRIVGTFILFVGLVCTTWANFV